MTKKKATKKEKPFKFTIDRKTWSRGAHGVGLRTNALCVSKQLAKISDELKAGSMCCLGHYAKACGVSERALLGKGSPQDLSKRTLKTNEQLSKLIDTVDGYMTDLPVVDRLVDVNDGIETDKQKERAIIRLFKKVNVEVTFKG